VKVAYIVAAHRDLPLLERLLRRLADDDTTLVVHVDARAGRGEFEALRRRTADLDLQFLDRHRGYWGGFGVVRAALAGIRHLVTSGDEFAYVGLLSGQDYPLRPAAAIRAELAAAGGRSFLYHFPLPFPGWDPNGGYDRIRRWHLISPLVLHLRVPWERRIPGGLAPFGGGRPWLLSREAVEYVDAVVRDRPELIAFFRHVLHPSELFFQTILLNSPLAPSIVADHRQYIRWAGGASPATLTVDDLDVLLASDCLFARKFDRAVDTEILDRLDALALRESHAVGS
jgi:hypothetical protein